MAGAAAGVSARRLPVSNAFHSRLVAGAAQSIAAFPGRTLHGSDHSYTATDSVIDEDGSQHVRFERPVTRAAGGFEGLLEQLLSPRVLAVVAVHAAQVGERRGDAPLVTDLASQRERLLEGLRGALERAAGEVRGPEVVEAEGHAARVTELAAHLEGLAREATRGGVVPTQ